MLRQNPACLLLLGIPSVGRGVLFFRLSIVLIFFFFFYSAGTSLGLAVANFLGWLSYLELHFPRPEHTLGVMFDIERLFGGFCETNC